MHRWALLVHLLLSLRCTPGASSCLPQTGDAIVQLNGHMQHNTTLHRLLLGDILLGAACVSGSSCNMQTPWPMACRLRLLSPTQFNVVYRLQDASCTQLLVPIHQCRVRKTCSFVDCWLPLVRIRMGREGGGGGGGVSSVPYLRLHSLASRSWAWWN